MFAILSAAKTIAVVLIWLPVMFADVHTKFIKLLWVPKKHQILAFELVQTCSVRLFRYSHQNVPQEMLRKILYLDHRDLLPSPFIRFKAKV